MLQGEGGIREASKATSIDLDVFLFGELFVDRRPNHVFEDVSQGRLEDSKDSSVVVCKLVTASDRLLPIQLRIINYLLWRCSSIGCSIRRPVCCVAPLAGYRFAFSRTCRYQYRKHPAKSVKVGP